MTLIPRRYLHDDVAERLRALIRQGDLVPGERLVELELAERFGISRTPLREAIKILATEGLLELLPNRGARVASLSVAEIEEMLDVIGGLEATAGDLAARRAEPAEIAAIAAMTARMGAAYEAGDEAGYFALNRAIHEAIVAAARNATLAQIYASLSGRVQSLRYRAHKTEAQWAQAIDDHGRIVQALAARDSAALRDILRAHVRSKRDVIAQFAGEPPAAPETAPAA